MKRRLRIIAAIALALFVIPAVALAFITRSGNGSLQAAAEGMPAGVQPAASTVGRNVELRWAPSRFTDATPATSYTVTGTAPGGLSRVATCPGTVAADNTVSCTLTGLAPATWSFVVRPVYATWTGAASPSSTATVAAAIVLASPSTINDGGSFVARTQSFLSNELVTYRWGSASGPVLGSATTAYDGSSEATLVVPVGTANGSYLLHAIGNAGDTTTTSITVANRPRTANPVAVDDRSWGSGTIDVFVLANDTDANGDPLTVIAASKPKHGTVTVLADRVRYLPAGYLGDDSFTYTVSDGQGGTATAKVTVAVGLEYRSLLFGPAPNDVLSLGNDATTANPVVPSVRARSAGLMELLRVGPAANNAVGWVVNGINIRVLAPAATVDAPIIITFRVETTAPGRGNKPAAIPVKYNGKTVPACTGVLPTATPDPCVRSTVYEASTNDTIVTVLVSHT